MIDSVTKNLKTTIAGGILFVTVIALVAFEKVTLIEAINNTIFKVASKLLKDIAIVETFIKYTFKSVVFILLTIIIPFEHQMMDKPYC